MKIKKYITNVLKKHKVDKVFTVPGALVEPMLYSCEKNSIEVISASGECQASLIAQRYGFEKETFGFCLFIDGAGITSSLSGISVAYTENKPLLVITGSEHTNRKNKATLQNTSESGVETHLFLEKCTVFNQEISSSLDFEKKFLKALSLMKKHSKPVHLKIPNNILNEKIKPNKKIKKNKNKINKKDIDYILDIIKNNKVNFFIGKNCYKIGEILENISFKYNINLIEVNNGRGIVSNRHEKYKGIYGIIKTIDESIIEKSDYNIFIGASISDFNTNNWNPKLVNKNMIYINDNFFESKHNFKIKKNILTELEPFFYRILNFEKKQYEKKYFDDEDFQKNNFDVYNKRNVSPKDLMSFFSYVSNKEDSVFFDIGNSFLWGTLYWKPKNKYNKQNVNIGDGFGMMGWAIGNSIGASLAKKYNQIFCFTGDGSVLMSSQEIFFHKERGSPIIFIILNDSKFGMVHHGQKSNNDKNIGTKLPEINFSKYFKSGGLKTFNINNIEDLFHIEDEIKNNRETIVLDVRINSSVTPPLGERTNLLK